MITVSVCKSTSQQGAPLNSGAFNQPKRLQAAYTTIMGKLQHLQTLTGHRGRVWGANWHHTTDTLATCGEDKTIRLWVASGTTTTAATSAATPDKRRRHWTQRNILADGHTRTVRDVSFSPAGAQIAAASFDATTSVWDIGDDGQYECNATLEGHENEVKSVAWSRDGRLLATCSRDKSVWIWETPAAAEKGTNGRSPAQPDDGGEFECAAVLSAHTQDVKRVAWHPHDDVLASASYDNTVKLFREDPSDNDWLCTATLTGHTSTVWGVAFDARGERLVTGSADGTVRIWQSYGPGNAEGVETPDGDTAWRCVCTLSGFHTRSVYDVSWCHVTGE